jgi:hypothetical protein
VGWNVAVFGGVVVVVVRALGLGPVEDDGIGIREISGSAGAGLAGFVERAIVPVRRGPDMNMQSMDLPTFSGVQVKWPEAAAPHRTPQMRGTQVTGLVS